MRAMTLWIGLHPAIAGQVAVALIEQRIYPADSKGTDGVFHDLILILAIWFVAAIIFGLSLAERFRSTERSDSENNNRNDQ